jgi:hypothetical protein
MTTSKAGIVAVAILLVVTGIGFGIAQAGGTGSEGPVLSFEDMNALVQGGSSSSFVENRPVLSFEDVTQMENPIGTGSLPAEGNSDSSIVETERNMYRAGEDTGAP